MLVGKTEAITFVRLSVLMSFCNAASQPKSSGVAQSNNDPIERSGGVSCKKGVAVREGRSHSTDQRFEAFPNNRPSRPALRDNL